MLGKLILLLLQIGIAWFLAPILHAKIPVSADLGLFLYAILFGILVFLTGVLGAQVLQGVGGPSSATLSASLILALIVAAVITFLPEVAAAVPGTISHRGLVLAGAIIGYWVKR